MSVILVLATTGVVGFVILGLLRAGLTDTDAVEFVSDETLN